MTRLAALPRMLAPPLVLSLAASGCVTFRTVDDGIARARIGETVVREGVAIMPLAVLEDSRCPANVTCVQAGTVRIAAEVAGARTELALDRPAARAGGSITLVEVYPARRTDTTYYPDEYRFGFRLTR